MPTVLFVDQDEAFRKQLRILFEHSSGFDACVEARNDVEALAKITQLTLNLAVLDFSLPDMGALQLAGKLNALMPELPIFMLTTDYGPRVEKIALSYGITAVFSKLDDLAPLVANARAVCGIK